MAIFARPHYTSDATDFIESLKSANPAMEAGQRLGRSLLWDKQVDRDLQKDMLFQFDDKLCLCSLTQQKYLQ